MDEAIRFTGRILFLSAKRRRHAPPARRRGPVPGGVPAAPRQRLDGRDHPDDGDAHLRRAPGALPLCRLRGRRRNADRDRRHQEGRLRRDGRRQALRQGLVARVEPARGEGGRHPADRRRELRAHLPAELRQHRHPDHHGFLRARPHPRRGGDPAGGVPPRPRRADAGGDPRRRPAPVQQGPPHAAAPAGGGRAERGKPADDAGREDHRAEQGVPGRRRDEPGDGIVLRADWRFSHDYFTGMCAHIMHGAFGTGLELERPEQIIAFQDHMVLADESFPHVQGNMVPAVRDLHEAHRRFASTYPVRHHGQLPGERGAEGICHAIMAERYALPGAGGDRDGFAHPAFRGARRARLRRRRHRHRQ